jgi:hypothetical protein
MSQDLLGGIYAAGEGPTVGKVAPMSLKRTDLLRWQFDLCWSLLDYHLERLQSEDLLWEPAATCWTVRQDATGAWVPDWQVPEPDPVPVPTVAWITWHLGWWWSVACDHAAGRPARERTDVMWPGETQATIAWLHDLRGEWAKRLETLTDAELDDPAAFPWEADAGLTLAHMVAWVNSELMKNASELGQLRMLRAAA